MSKLTALLAWGNQQPSAQAKALMFGILIGMNVWAATSWAIFAYLGCACK